MADDLIKRLATEQRKRLVASIMSYAEQSSWWMKLSVPEQRAYREKVLNSIGVFYDFILDVIKVGSDGMVNEHAIEMIERVHQSQQRVERALLDERTLTHAQ